MIHSEKIQQKLESIRIQPLTASERDFVWERVSSHCFLKNPITRQSSRYATRFKIATAITLIFGMTAGTTFAADDARPGDLLFPVDRAIENFQISIAPEKRKNELKVEFALERVAEVKDIIQEMSAPSPSQQNIENKNVPEHNPNIATLETISSTSSSSTDDFHNDDPVEIAPAVERAQPSVQTPATTSNTEINIPDDLSVEKKQRIELALGTALSFLGEVKGELSETGDSDDVSHIDFMIDQMNKEIETLPGNITFEVDLSSNTKGVTFEVTSQDDKPKIQIEVTPKKEGASTTTASTTNNSPASTTPVDEVTQKSAKQETPTTAKLTITNGDITITKPSEQKKEEPKENPSDNTSSIATSSKTTDPDEEKIIIDDDTTSSKETTEKSTTTVKVFLKKLDKDFQFSTTDNKATIHTIIENYLVEKDKTNETH